MVLPLFDVVCTELYHRQNNSHASVTEGAADVNAIHPLSRNKIKRWRH